MSTKRLIYVVDLDDTLCRSPYGPGLDGKLSPQYFDAEPIKERIEHINQLYDQGHIIIIETARGSHSGRSWFFKTLHQLKDWGLKFDHLRAGVKYSADFYIDDKAINSEDFFSV
jgi:hypothetical protein